MFKRNLLAVLWVMVALNAIYLGLRLGDRFGFGSGAERERELARFSRVLEAVNENYVEPDAASYEKLTTRSLEDMLRSLDPHSEFLRKRDFENVQSDLRSEFGGIGVQIEFREQKVTVIAPIAGTPGERAGILRGDQIVKVDGKELEGPSVSKAVEKLRGPPGTKVAVTLFRPTSGKNLDFELTREIIKVSTIRATSMVRPGVGYIHLTQFTERTADEFRAALAKLEGEGMTALVLDLRNNPGGLLTAAVSVVEPFFEDGELVLSTKGRNGKLQHEHRANGSGKPRGYPVAVLVNSGSASAAEIVTGALRDTHRAVIVGERTFGKGSVQTLLPLGEGEAVRLTTARYYTPSGRVIHGKGIDPDVEIPVSVEDDGKLALQRARNDFASAADFKERFGFEPIPDRQLEAAIDVLHGVLAFAPANGVPAPVATAAR